MPTAIYKRTTTAEFNVFEQAVGLGPPNLGVTTPQESLFQSIWRILRDVTNILTLEKQELSSWVSKPFTDVPPAMPLTARHMFLAFDTSGNEVVGWEEPNEANGTIRVHQSNGIDYNTYSFLGVDPVAFNDASVSKNFVDGDIHVIYMAQDRLSVKYRTQRDLYSIERNLYTLTSPAVLDLVVPYFKNYACFLSDVVTANNFYLLSDTYPVLTSNGPELDPFEAYLAANYIVTTFYQQAQKLSIGAEASNLGGEYLITTALYDALQKISTNEEVEAIYDQTTFSSSNNANALATTEELHAIYDSLTYYTHVFGLNSSALLNGEYIATS